MWSIRYFSVVVSPGVRIRIAYIGQDFNPYPAIKTSTINICVLPSHLLPTVIQAGSLLRSCPILLHNFGSVQQKLQLTPQINIPFATPITETRTADAFQVR